MNRMNKESAKLAGAVATGLFAGILVGYVLGVNRKAGDDKILAAWMKDGADYEDGNVFGYETGLPEGFHDQPATKVLKPQRGSIK